MRSLSVSSAGSASLKSSYLSFSLSTSFFFFFNAPATTEIYTLSLHDALPISLRHIECFPDPSGYPQHLSRLHTHTSCRASVDSWTAQMPLFSTQPKQTPHN